MESLISPFLTIVNVHDVQNFQFAAVNSYQYTIRIQSILLSEQESVLLESIVRHAQHGGPW